MDLSLSSYIKNQAQIGKLITAARDREKSTIDMIAGVNAIDDSISACGKFVGDTLVIWFINNPDIHKAKFVQIVNPSNKIAFPKVVSYRYLWIIIASIEMA